MVGDTVISPQNSAGRDMVVEVLNSLVAELTGEPEESWENVTLERYLEALAAILESYENHYVNTGTSIPDDPWVIMSEALTGARYYE